MTMTKSEKKNAIDSLKKGIAIYKKNIEFWQIRKKEAETMILHNRNNIREDQNKIKMIQRLK